MCGSRAPSSSGGCRPRTRYAAAAGPVSALCGPVMTVTESDERPTLHGQHEAGEAVVVPPIDVQLRMGEEDANLEKVFMLLVGFLYLLFGFPVSLCKQIRRSTLQ